MLPQGSGVLFCVFFCFAQASHGKGPGPKWGAGPKCRKCLFPHRYRSGNRAGIPHLSLGTAEMSLLVTPELSMTSRLQVEPGKPGFLSERAFSCSMAVMWLEGEMK